MAIYQNPEPEAPQRTKRRDDVGWSGLTISLAVHGILIILAIFVFYKWVSPPKEPAPDFQGAGGGGGGNNGQIANKVQTQMRHSMTSATARRVAAATTSDFTLPESSEDLVTSDVPNISALSSSGTGGGGGGGNGGGLGTGNGLGNGPGHGSGNGKMLIVPDFGSKEKIANSLEGHLYDFKQTEKGVAVPYDVVAIEPFATRVLELQKRGFSDGAFNHFFKAPDTLYLTRLAIKPQPAEAGPSFFGAADKVKPSGWLAHYSGIIKAPRDMQFRFVGSADDYISVFTKTRPRLIACRPEVQELMQGKWDPGKTDGTYAGPMGTLIFGDWIRMKKGETMPIELCIGERPGGIVGFLLLVEEKDVDYKKAADGRPIIPIFTTEEVSPELKEQISRDFSGWEFDWDHVPVFSGVANGGPPNPFR